MAIKVWIHDDQPCPCDKELERLGMEATAQVVSSLALNNPGPLSIGVFGRWGTGKTTVLDRVAKLCGQKMPVVRLNPWEHEREADPLASLLLELKSELERIKEVRDFNWLEQVYIALMPRFRYAMSGLTPKIGLVLTAAWLKSQGQALGELPAGIASLLPDANDEPESWPQTFRSTRQELENAIGERKFVVTLDDLDRCRPDRALAVLEAVKHLLWAKGFVFVLALDPTVLEAFLQKLHEDEFGVPEPGVGRRYLEKLVQAQVPVVHRDLELFREYVEMVVHEAIEQNKEWIPDEAEKGGVPALLAAAAARQPRQAKRLVNSVIIDWALAYEGGV